MKKIGILILLVGALILVFTLFNLTFFTKERVIDVGEFQVKERKAQRLNWTPLLGVTVMAVGGGIYLLGIKKPLAHT